jgi:hypothetical protein
MRRANRFFSAAIVHDELILSKEVSEADATNAFHHATNCVIPGLEMRLDTKGMHAKAFNLIKKVRADPAWKKKWKLQQGLEGHKSLKTQPKARATENDPVNIPRKKERAPATTLFQEEERIGM